MFIVLTTKHTKTSVVNVAHCIGITGYALVAHRTSSYINLELDFEVVKNSFAESARIRYSGSLRQEIKHPQLRPVGGAKLYSLG
jgi:hypothetical protein